MKNHLSISPRLGSVETVRDTEDEFNGVYLKEVLN